MVDFTITPDLKIKFPLAINGAKIWLHSEPISEDVFDQFFDELSWLYAKIQRESLWYDAAIGSISKHIRKYAEKQGTLHGLNGLEQEFFSVILAKTTAFVPAEKGGYEQLPLSTLIARGQLSGKTVRTIEGILLFFTLGVVNYEGEKQADFISGTIGRYSVQSTLLSATECLSSLPTLTEAASSGETGNT